MASTSIFFKSLNVSINTFNHNNQRFVSLTITKFNTNNDKITQELSLRVPYHPNAKMALVRNLLQDKSSVICKDSDIIRGMLNKDSYSFINSLSLQF